MKGVAVVGAGGHAKVVIATCRAAGVSVGGLFAHDERTHGSRVLGVEVKGGLQHPDLEGAEVIIAIGRNAIRREIAGLLDDRVRWRSVVHPRAWVHESVRLGNGTTVFAGSVVQPGSVIGDHVIVNTGATVDHDCRLEDYTHVAPGSHLAGGVRLDAGAFMGIASSAVPGVAVGSWATVGAGATVIEDIPAGVTAVGTPARAV